MQVVVKSNRETERIFISGGHKGEKDKHESERIPI